MAGPRRASSLRSRWCVLPSNPPPPGGPDTPNEPTATTDSWRRNQPSWRPWALSRLSPLRPDLEVRPCQVTDPAPQLGPHFFHTGWRLGYEPSKMCWRSKCTGRTATILRQKIETGTSVMLSFARVLDRVRPQASLAIALVFSVAWIAAFDYGLLRLVW
jgi:hypothetical protein